MQGDIPAKYGQTYDTIPPFHWHNGWLTGVDESDDDHPLKILDPQDNHWIAQLSAIIN